MTEQDPRPRTSIALAWPTRERLAARERIIAAREDREMSADKAVWWLLDLADKTDAEATP